MMCSQNPCNPCNNCGSCGKPHHSHCPPPPPPIRPVNINPCGDTHVWGRIRELEKKVNEAVCGANGVIERANCTINQLKCVSQENGAFYSDDEVSVENGYIDGSTYYVVAKKACDKRGKPIRMELKLAYDNTTNSLIKQDAFSASQIEYAQIMVPALSVNDNVGFYGLSRWRNAPIPSTSITGLYTIGFSKTGRMMVYNNTQDPAQLSRDSIENSMGSYGILVQGRTVTDESLRNQIPMYDQRVGRVCIGQNYASQITYILACGGDDGGGMTSLTAANILQGYGCDVAVEVAQYVTSCALDKGQLLYAPDNNTIPETYAYWYITKKREYCSQFTYELAELMMKYGQCQWMNQLQGYDITSIKLQIEAILSRLNITESDFTEVKKKIQELEAAVALLQQSDASLQGQINDLVDRLAKEITDRIAGENALQSEIDAINSGIADLPSIRVTLNQHTGQIQDLQSRVAALESLVSILNTNYGTMSGRLDAVEVQLAALDATVATYNQRLADIETALNTVKADMSTLTALVNTFDGRITDVENSVIQMESDVQELRTVVGTISDQITNIISTLNSHDERITVLENNAMLPVDPALQESIKNDTYLPIGQKENTIRYYVTQTGDDTNDGQTEATALRTLTEALRRVETISTDTAVRFYFGAGRWSINYHLFSLKNYLHFYGEDAWKDGRIITPSDVQILTNKTIFTSSTNAQDVDANGVNWQSIGFVGGNSFLYFSQITFENSNNGTVGTGQGIVLTGVKCAMSGCFITNIGNNLDVLFNCQIGNSYIDLTRFNGANNLVRSSNGNSMRIVSCYGDGGNVGLSALGAIAFTNNCTFNVTTPYQVSVGGCINPDSNLPQ